MNTHFALDQRPAPALDVQTERAKSRAVRPAVSSSPLSRSELRAEVLAVLG